jgi:hypothetical protein
MAKGTRGGKRAAGGASGRGSANMAATTRSIIDMEGEYMSIEDDMREIKSYYGLGQQRMVEIASVSSYSVSEDEFAKLKTEARKLYNRQRVLEDNYQKLNKERIQVGHKIASRLEDGLGSRNPSLRRMRRYNDYDIDELIAERQRLMARNNIEL